MGWANIKPLQLAGPVDDGPGCMVVHCCVQLKGIKLRGGVT